MDIRVIDIDIGFEGSEIIVHLYVLVDGSDSIGASVSYDSASPYGDAFKVTYYVENPIELSEFHRALNGYVMEIMNRISSRDFISKVIAIKEKFVKDKKQLEIELAKDVGVEIHEEEE